MPGQTLTTGAFVIDKRPPSESFQAFGLFSAENGNLAVLHRVPRKPSASHVSLDLFDEVAAVLETSNQGRTWFVREVRISERRTAIGKSYESLAHASALAAVIWRNPVHEESRPGVERLLRAALSAFAGKDRPDIIYLKSLYVFARDEGYPVREEWLPSLGAGERQLAESAIARPVEWAAVPRAQAALIRRSLEDYLRASTEIIIP
ncbi:MAG TPA: hypothetical protein VGG37_03260 [Opitutaceae bacterium]